MTPMPWGALSQGLDAELRSMAVERRIPRGGTLFAHGSPPDGFYCVEQGRLRVSVSGPNGREAVIGMYGPGQWFGEVSLFTGTPHLYDTRAIEATDILAVTASAFHRLMSDQPEFLLELTRLISLRYRRALDWIDETILLPLPVRLARRLIAAAAIHGQQFAQRQPVSLRMSQEDLSYMLGVSRQSVNRQLKAWEARNILRLDYGSVTLLDQDALQDLV